MTEEVADALIVIIRISTGILMGIVIGLMLCH